MTNSGVVEILLRIADGLYQISHKLRCARPIRHTMIDRKRQGHDGMDAGTSIGTDTDRYYSVNNRSDGKNRGLGWNNDRRECVDAKHAKIADRKSAAGDIGWTQLTTACTFC